MPGRKIKGREHQQRRTRKTMPSVERRAEQRLKVTEISAEVYEGGQQRWPSVNGRVVDLAASGMKIELYTRVRLEKDSTVFVNFSLPSGHSFFRKEARVAWKSFKPRSAKMGLNFVDQSEEDRRNIRTFLSNKDAQRPRES
jgi:c-di-GMP-binding flagellar brake protein YcgR